jgi:hypothetical protein
MIPPCWDLGVPRAKAEGLRHFEKRGYRVAAVVDSEPDNIAAMAAMPELEMGTDVLFLQPNAFVQSQDLPTPQTDGNHDIAGPALDYEPTTESRPV